MVKRLPVCGRTFDGLQCAKRGDHLCGPRVAHVEAFFSEILVHTKGRWARTPFRLAKWQLDDVMSPLFGTVTFSPEFQRYVRRYRLAWLEVARKNGKALDVDTPILSGRGWTTMGQLVPGDQVHAVDGALVDVQWVSDRHQRPSYLVRFADGAEIVAADDHKWQVNDRQLAASRKPASRIATTQEIANSLHFDARGDRRYSVDVPEPVQRPELDLPLDPYVLGAWLGDGTAARGELTSADPQIINAFTDAGYPPSYRYERGAAVTRGFPKLGSVLRRLDVLNNKHIPEQYLTASYEQRLALLRGLMDTDGSVIVGPNTPRVEFTTVTPALASGVLELARSLGFKASVRTSRAMLNGRDCGPRWRVTWTAWRNRSPFSLPRKTDLLAECGGRTRSHTNAIVAVEPVGEREVVCIAVDHPSHVFLAGRSFTPTHNSELLAGIALYLLIADDEQGSEIYGCAMDRDQARKVFDVAERMVQLSPLLSSRLRINKQAKRIYDTTTGSYYEATASDSAGNLGHNPHGIVFDEVLTQKNSDLWNAMRTGMGAREQPLMVAATTAGDDPQSFAKQEHDEMVKIAEDPSRAPHILVYIRNLPYDADPWDESLWHLANPALGEFLSMQSLRDEATEAMNDPAKENAFRQFRLNQWQAQASRWMPMHLWDRCTGDLWLNPHWHNKELHGRTAYAGFDLAAKFDLTAWCLVVPGDERDDPAHIMWRFWLPEVGLERLDQYHDGKFTRWARQGWLTITEGSVIDYERVISDIAEDARDYRIRAADCDEWSMWPIINRIADTLNLDIEEGELTAYRNTYDRLSPGMTDTLGLVRRDLLRHHGNPVARFCFDQCTVRHAPYDPNLIRPEKPERGRDKARIDAVPAAAMAVNAWKSREGVEPIRSAYEDGKLMIV